MHLSLAQKKCFVPAEVCYAPLWKYQARACHVAGQLCVTEAWWSGGARHDTCRVYTDDAERHPAHSGVEGCCPCHALHRGAVPQGYGVGRRQMPRRYARRRRHAFPWGG